MDAFSNVRTARKSLRKLALLVAAGVLVGCADKSDLPSPDDPSDAIDAPHDSDVNMVGSIQVMTNRPVKILLDGKPAGQAPITIDNVTPGTHDVTYVDDTDPKGNVTLEVEVVAGQTSQVSWNLAPKAKETGQE